MEFKEELYNYLYQNKCPSDVELIEYTVEQGCWKGSNSLSEDLQVCRNCWQNAIINIQENN